MSSDLRLDWCSPRAAAYACRRWHYSQSMPAGPTVVVGVWEGGVFKGVVIFARGATPHLGDPYRLSQMECVELARVALREHVAPVSQIVAIAVRMLRRHCPGLRLIVSFADPAHDHVGIIYQAMGWLYTGRSEAATYYRDRQGRLWHARMVTSTGVTTVFGASHRVQRRDQTTPVRMPGKYRYLLPLDGAMRGAVAHLVKPYPKRAGGASSTASDQLADGGSSPTPALQVLA